MTKIDWVKWSAIAEVLSAIAIVATLLYLAIQTEQNNQLLQSESRLSRTDRGLDRYSEVFQNADLARALAKLRDSEELSGLDEMLIEAYALRSFRNWEANFDEAQRGNLNEERIANTQRMLIEGEGSLAPIPWERFWETYRPRASLAFVEWMETRIFGD